MKGWTAWAIHDESRDSSDDVAIGYMDRQELHSRTNRRSSCYPVKNCRSRDRDKKPHRLLAVADSLMNDP